jgi:uncharacterized protein with NRDE domain
VCVAAIAWEAHPHWRLVAVGNRDEFHKRLAAPLARWDNDTGIIAGRDLQSGGTWLGVSEIGNFVLVTNLRGYGGPDSSRTSRGELVAHLLEGRQDPDQLDRYNPFNLIHADKKDARFITNRPDATRARLAHGVYALSNGSFDVPWAKTMQLKSALLDWLVTGEHGEESLLEALEKEELGDFGLHPLLPSDVPVEARETPVFIRNSVYGTRCSTVIMIDRAGNGRIIERRFSPEGEKTGQTALEFSWPG